MVTLEHSEALVTHILVLDTMVLATVALRASDILASEATAATAALPSATVVHSKLACSQIIIQSYLNRFELSSVVKVVLTTLKGDSGPRPCLFMDGHLMHHLIATLDSQCVLSTFE